MSAKFEIFLGSNQQYYFRLKAPNGEKILASEAYTTKASCQNGIQSVKVHSPYDANYKKLTATNSQYYFTLNAGNGQVIGVSETYTTTQARDGGIAAVKAYAPTALVVDLT
ncbi:MAG: hypothetical protein CUR33_11020 [Pseudomonas sp.]|uniref:YegP family protein n=1 Tax=Pseudomonas sp. FEMGT703P TaxID=2080764 RepID=UPI000CC2E86D|nr:YegP family protein [Pseudomonas sp. FEMGT703P]PJE41927.1 MAG: hypothetical protein CUR33_11020 [Pseudomonas sp.] [Pseudomonas sp. FEMGT703P]